MSSAENLTQSAKLKENSLESDQQTNSSEYPHCLF